MAVSGTLIPDPRTLNRLQPGHHRGQAIAGPREHGEKQMLFSLHRLAVVSLHFPQEPDLPVWRARGWIDRSGSLVGRAVQGRDQKGDRSDRCGR